MIQLTGSKNEKMIQPNESEMKNWFDWGDLKWENDPVEWIKNGKLIWTGSKFCVVDIYLVFDLWISEIDSLATVVTFKTSQWGVSIVIWINCTWPGAFTVVSNRTVCIENTFWAFWTFVVDTWIVTWKLHSCLGDTWTKILRNWSTWIFIGSKCWPSFEN